MPHSLANSLTKKNEKPKVNLTDIEEARRVLALESQALEALSKGLGAEFTAAVENLFKTTGRVIVTGMGKSGHVGTKIASTLASTGTPSTFVHPAEASHGDLGMITKNDTILALSNSGETSELSDILAYAKRHGIPLIGITSNGRSTLDKTADVSLVLPKREEACPLGLAPTTSTTMMIALGDALATAVLKRRGFSATDFSSLHPGGKLGQRLMRVEKLMHRAPKMPLIQQGAPMEDALLKMTSQGFGCVGVLGKEGNLMGMVTDGDLRRHMGGDLMSAKVVEIMTQNPRVIHKNILAEEALSRMNQAGITSFFVVESDQEADRKPVGILHIHDCLRAGIQ
tara:strand:- start:946 stop:1968 length:1023 start_codon:yes stop_codon:yes gene_type:complete